MARLVPRVRVPALRVLLVVEGCRGTRGGAGGAGGGAGLLAGLLTRGGGDGVRPVYVQHPLDVRGLRPVGEGIIISV